MPPHHGHGRHHRGHQNGKTQAPPEPRKKTVLVVEDFASVGGLIAGLLRQEGYRVIRAWGAEEGLKQARGRSPDAVLLDLNLAYPNGLEILGQIRQQDGTRKAPIVVVGGQNLALSAEERSQVLDVVSKPFDIDVMLNAVRQALGEPLVEVQPRTYDAQDYFLNGY